MIHRPRRLRSNESIRELIAETRVSVSSLMQPYFLSKDRNAVEPITNFTGVHRYGIDKLLKEKALAQSGLVDNKAIEAGQFLGAEGTMLGEITAHELKSETVESELPSEGPGKYDAKLDKGDGSYFQRDKKWFKKDKRDTFQFQIVVRLISNIDSQTILTLQNEYPVRTYTVADGGLRPANLDQFRAQVLAQMGKDLEKALKEARE